MSGYFPQIVKIVSTEKGGAYACGTGIMLKDSDNIGIRQGMILTNAHVVSDSPCVKVVFPFLPQQHLAVHVLSISHDHDLALLELHPTVNKWMKQYVKTTYQLDSIPCISLGDSNTLRAGDDLIAVGHPLGLNEQQRTFGKLQGYVHSSNELRALHGATINGGNSGGMTAKQMKQPVGKPINGMVYWNGEEDVHQVMIINTMKLIGPNVDGENGGILSNTVKMILPSMIQASTKYSTECDKQYQSQVRQRLQAQIQQRLPASKSSQSVQKVVSSLNDQQVSLMSEKFDDMLTHFEDHGIGGKVKGQSRSFGTWFSRYVLKPGSSELQEGAEECLTHLAENPFMTTKPDWRAMGAGTQQQRVEDIHVDPMCIPAVEVHAPIYGFHTRAILSVDMLVHYKCPIVDKKMVANGGVVVSSVVPKSLYEKAGGLKGDLIYKVSNASQAAHLDPGGMWYNDALGVQNSLLDFCQHTKVGDTLTFSVLRKTESGGSASLELSAKHALPTKEELPLVRKYHMYSDEGAEHSRSRLQCMGITLKQLDLDDVNKYQMVDYYPVKNRFAPVVMVESVDTRSPAYMKITPGSVLTHVNEKPIETSWVNIQRQLSKPHETTNCWVLETKSGQKFAMMVKK
tara:strand:+ start:73 stop:1953 length:1881 start_codon:yes stop_codon:yes gene_type:complete